MAGVVSPLPLRADTPAHGKVGSGRCSPPDLGRGDHARLLPLRCYWLPSFEIRMKKSLIACNAPSRFLRLKCVFIAQRARAAGPLLVSWGEGRPARMSRGSSEPSAQKQRDRAPSSPLRRIQAAVGSSLGRSRPDHSEPLGEGAQGLHASRGPWVTAVQGHWPSSARGSE